MSSTAFQDRDRIRKVTELDREEVLEALRDLGGEATVRQLNVRLRQPRPRIRSTLAALEKKGQITAVDGGETPQRARLTQ